MHEYEILWARGDRRQALAAYRMTSKWRDVARRTKIRAGWQCEWQPLGGGRRCQARSGLQAHHANNNYTNVFREQPEDLIAVCDRHHRLLDGRGAHPRDSAQLPLPLTTAPRLAEAVRLWRELEKRLSE